MHKLLIVEDDGAAREGLGQLLTLSGFSVSTARDGVEALEKLSQQEFDLMLMDIWMPRMDGLQLLAQLRDASNPPHVIVMTADGSPETLMLTLRKRAYQFLTKPIQPEMLLERLCSTLALPPDQPAIVVLSARPGWVEVLAPCTPDVADRIQSYMLRLDANLPQEVRETVGRVFQELLLDAMEWPGPRHPGRNVRIIYFRARRMLLYRIVDAAHADSPVGATGRHADAPIDNAGRDLTERSTALIARARADEVLFNENEVVVVKYLD